MTVEGNWISNAIAGVALFISGVTLYLQRRDVRPRLTVLAVDEDAPTRVRDGGGGYHDTGPKEPAQIFEIRNVGAPQVRLHSVRARWLLQKPRTVSGLWNRAPLLEVDTMCNGRSLHRSCSLNSSHQEIVYPFYKAEFLDSVGRVVK
jgi:hypothetical protein